MPDSDTLPDNPPAIPVAPDLADCCGSGCSPCVFDAYDTAMERYREALAAWNQRKQHADGVPSGK